MRGPFWHEKEVVLGDYFPSLQMSLSLVRLSTMKKCYRTRLLPKQAEVCHWDAAVSFLPTVHWNQVSATAGLELHVGSWKRSCGLCCECNTGGVRHKQIAHRWCVRLHWSQPVQWWNMLLCIVLGECKCSYWTLGYFRFKKPWWLTWVLAEALLFTSYSFLTPHKLPFFCFSPNLTLLASYRNYPEYFYILLSEPCSSRCITWKPYIKYKQEVGH